MPLRLKTALLCAIALIVLIPPLNLLLHVTQLSTRLLHTSSCLFLPPPKMQNANEIVTSKKHEMKYHFDNIAYFTPTHAAVQVFPLAHSANVLPKEQARYSPLTVIRLPLEEAGINYSTLSRTIDEYLSLDDVLTPAWLETLVLVPDYHTSGDISHQDSLKTWFIGRDTFARLAQDYNVKQIYIDPSYTLVHPAGPQGINIEVNIIISSLPSNTFTRGPYLGSIQKETNQLELWPVYRLYSDTYRAFLFGVYKPLPLQKPHSQSQYCAFREVDQLGYNQIPVPSRLSTPYSGPGKGPLRIGVKDLYDLNGVPTSAGSRAYGELYGPANETALSLQLLDPELGVFVGKTKSAAFATGAFAHEDHVDEQYPFSARGDGWQTCLGSSSGSACAMTAYDWWMWPLGHTLKDQCAGQQASQDCMGTGQVHVLLGFSGPSDIQFTTDLVPLDGVVPLWGYADTAGALARDPKLFADFNTAWLSAANVVHKHRKPATDLNLNLSTSLLVATDYLKQTNPEAQQVVDKFLEKVQGTLGLTVDRVVLDDLLEEGGYTTEHTNRLHTNLSLSAAWWSWKKNGEALFHDYAIRHGGRRPGLDPRARKIWSRARDSGGSLEKYMAATKHFKGFQQWLTTNVLTKDDAGYCADQIMVSSPGLGGEPMYREKALNHDVFERRKKLWATDICSFGGCADHTIPIGQVPYLSKISNVVEQQPVTISLIARPGCDVALFMFVKQLAEAGLISTVNTGRTAF